MLKNNGEGVITEVSKLEKIKYKPYPLTTVNFQKLAVRKLRISSEKAMKLAEGLYQRGIISYPRTETNSFPYTMNLKNIISNISDQPYEDYICKNLLFVSF
jgi:DNA topoisomerase-3